jgi:hypothetical protein
MAKSVIRRRPKRPGQLLKVASHRFDPLFLSVLRNYSEQIGTSQSELLERGALKAWPDLRRAVTAARATNQSTDGKRP